MTITGYQFDKAKVTALHDSILYHWLANKQNFILDGIGSEMAVTTEGLSATVDTGAAIVCGRMIEVTSPETVEIPANSRGYLALYIDLSAENTATGVPGEASYEVQNNQISVRFVTNLTQQDLFQGGLIYTFNLGTIETSASSVVRFVSSNSVKKRSQGFKLTEDDGRTIYSYDTDLNTLTTNGTRWINPQCPHSPFPKSYGFVETSKATTDIYQIARSWQDGWKVFRRYCLNFGKPTEKWSDWENITPTAPTEEWKSAGYSGTYYKRSADVLAIKFNFTGTGGNVVIGNIPSNIWKPLQDCMFIAPQWSHTSSANIHIKFNYGSGAINAVETVKGALYLGQILIMM